MQRFKTDLEKAMFERGVTADALHEAVGGHRNDVNQWISGSREVPAVRCQAVVDFIQSDWLTIYHLRSDFVRVEKSA